MQNFHGLITQKIWVNQLMRKLLLLSLTTALYCSGFYYSFANIGISYLDWSSLTQERTTQEDFPYISLEGGAGWEWGEFYGIANIENPTRTPTEDAPNDLRYTAVVDFDIKIKDGWRLHLQDYYLDGRSFDVNDFMVGVAYKYQNNSGFWLRPFLSLHFTNDTYFNGLNGYMGGWLLNYDFNLFEEKFGIFQWNEIEFAREKRFYQDGDGESMGDGASYGLNGALSIWWYLNKTFTTALQYRYANHKLGNIEYQDAVVYTLKYNLY